MNYKSILIKSLPLIIGGLAGYAYYYFIGCNNGTCAIQSNPYISTLYGIAAGIIFIPSGKTQKKSEQVK